MKTCCIHNEVEKESGRISQIEEVIYNLNEHKNRQIEENRKISTRVDELEKEIEQLKEIQKASDIFYLQVRNDHSVRISELEKVIKQLEKNSHSHSSNIKNSRRIIK